jgi:hypothetical protein
MLHTHLSSGADTIGELLAHVRSGVSLIPPHEKLKKGKSALLYLGLLSFL